MPVIGHSTQQALRFWQSSNLMLARPRPSPVQEPHVRCTPSLIARSVSPQGRREPEPHAALSSMSTGSSRLSSTVPQGVDEWAQRSHRADAPLATNGSEPYSCSQAGWVPASQRAAPPMAPKLHSAEYRRVDRVAYREHVLAEHRFVHRRGAHSWTRRCSARLRYSFRSRGPEGTSRDLRGYVVGAVGLEPTTSTV